jgi:hypothetical protein
MRTSGSRQVRALREHLSRKRAAGYERAGCNDPAERTRHHELHASDDEERSGKRATRERQRPGKRSRPQAPCIGAEDGGAGHHVTT